MPKNTKASTQDTGKAETTANEIKPASGRAPKRGDSTATGETAQKQGKKTVAGNEGKAEDATIKSETKSKTSTSSTKKTTGKNTGKAKAGVNTETSSATPDVSTISGTDRDAIIASVDADAEKQTGRPTGAIYGSGGDIIAVQNPAGSGQAAQEAVPFTKVYGIIQSSGNTVSLSQGSIPEGRLQLVGEAKDKGFKKQISGYNEQFVTVLGTYQPADGNSDSSRFLVRSIASHSDIARRAYELSESGGTSPEDNWIRAENDILGQG